MSILSSFHMFTVVHHTRMTALVLGVLPDLPRIGTWRLAIVIFDLPLVSYQISQPSTTNGVVSTTLLLQAPLWFVHDRESKRLIQLTFPNV